MRKKTGKKGECIYILNKVKYYTKESVKIVKIAIIAFVIITAIILIKYKPSYKVTILGKQYGYIDNKKQLEENIEKIVDDFEDERIEFVSTPELQYELKLINRQEKTNETEIISELKENAVETYKVYAITLNGQNKAFANTLEEANKIVTELKEELNGNLELPIGIQDVYTQNIEELYKDTTVLADASIEEEIEYLVKAQKSTVNGISLATRPTTGTISSRFGRRTSGMHRGLDICGPIGTDIVASASGTVTYSGWKGSYGNLIVISHGNGIETAYAHCSKLYVDVADEVKEGQLIGKMGSTGNSTGSHLHFEVRVNGTQVNPQNYLYN